MKSTYLKIFITLILCVLCFASCDESKISQSPNNDISTNKIEQNSADINNDNSQEKIDADTSSQKFSESTACMHVEGEWIIDIEANLYSEGSQHTECIKCGIAISYETIPKLICDHASTEWIVDQEATVFEEGERHLECSICGDTINVEEIEKLVCDHSDTLWVTDVEPTLDDKGEKHLSCLICNNVLSYEVIPKLELTESQIVEKLKNSVVKVICYDYDGKTEISQGSGFFIDKNGTFITNAHVVENCYYIKVKTHSSFEYDVDVMYVYNYASSDYAICRIKGYYSSTPVEFESSADVGDKVYALGYPNDAWSMKTTSGVITSTDTVDGSKHFYSNTALIDHGSSGGVLANAQGKVLGITTGIFKSGEYACLKYSEFKKDAEKSHFGSKEPLEYFHTVDKIHLNSYNMDDYFDISVDATAISDTNVRYSVSIRLKQKYINSKFLLDSSRLSITIKIDTEYNYVRIASYGKNNITDRDTKFLYFYFYNEMSLSSGITEHTSSSIYISSIYDYYNMDISYEIDFFGGLGTLIIFDK